MYNISMKYERCDGGFAVYDYNYFEPSQSFDCGQCFRFEMESDGTWSGVARGVFFGVKAMGDHLFIRCESEDDLTGVILPFLALDEDYGLIREDIRLRFRDDPTMTNAMALGSGIRILRQEPWEALCSFIISQNNNIPRIKKIIETLCEKYGAPLSCGRYAFPTPEALRDAGVDALFECRTGFRAKYIYDAACKVADGTLDLENVMTLPTAEADVLLQSVKGVGAKVSACALLFGLGKTDAFPIDVWMKRIIDKYYDGNLDVPSLGRYAGIAQQYLFYYIRSIEIPD